MKRKNIISIIAIVILLLTIVFIIIYNLSNNSHNAINTQYKVENKTTISDDKIIDVDELINTLLNSDEYSKMSDDEKEEACKKLLNELKAKKAIKNYSYSNSDMLYSFEYNDGSLGGIKLKDWEPNFN